MAFCFSADMPHDVDMSRYADAIEPRPATPMLHRCSSPPMPFDDIADNDDHDSHVDASAAKPMRYNRGDGMMRGKPHPRAR